MFDELTQNQIKAKTILMLAIKTKLTIKFIDKKSTLKKS